MYFMHICFIEFIDNFNPCYDDFLPHVYVHLYTHPCDALTPVLLRHHFLLLVLSTYKIQF